MYLVPIYHAFLVVCIRKIRCVCKLHPVNEFNPAAWGIRRRKLMTTYEKFLMKCLTWFSVGHLRQRRNPILDSILLFNHKTFLPTSEQTSERQWQMRHKYSRYIPLYDIFLAHRYHSGGWNFSVCCHLN